MKCESCPIAGACIGEREGWSFACKMANGTPAERRFVADHSAKADGKALPEPSYPPLAQQAKNLAKSILTFAKTKCKMVDQAEFDRRHAICEACEKFDAKQNRCVSCGCSMSVKPWGKAMDCPLGKWTVPLKEVTPIPLGE